MSKRRQIPRPPRQSIPDQGELFQHSFKADANDSPSHVLPPEGQSAPSTSPSITPTTGVTGPSVQFADGDLGPVVRMTASSGPEIAEAEVEKVLQLVHTEGAVGASRESVDKVSIAPQVKAHSDKNESHEDTRNTGTGVDGTQSTAAEREKARNQVNEMARPPSGFNDASTDSYPRGPYDPRMEADQQDMQMDFSTPMDKDDDESVTGFGALSNTTFHPLLTYQPHLYGHSLNVEQDEHIIEDIGSGLGVDSVMGDATLESQNVDVHATATRAPQPFSWVPPSTSGAFHTIFPVVPFARPQMTACIDESVQVFQHRTLNGPYGVDTTVSEEARIQQVAPPQDTAWPFILDGVYPSPSMEGGLLKFVYAKHSPISGPSVFPGQATNHSTFPSPCPPTSRVDVPVSSPTRRPIVVHMEDVKDLEGEVCPEPAVTASVQRAASPPRYV